MPADAATRILIAKFFAMDVAVHRDRLIDPLTCCLAVFYSFALCSAVNVDVTVLM
jgi:hypothetical protein